MKIRNDVIDCAATIKQILLANCPWLRLESSAKTKLRAIGLSSLIVHMLGLLLVNNSQDCW